MSIIITFILAVGLSMDAFSLSLIYGTLDLKNNMRKSMSIMVGIFHFFMPILGYKIGELILNLIKINPDILVGIIFIILGLEMLISLKKDEKLKILTGILSVILFSFTVSIDSFSTGIGLGVVEANIVLSSAIFSIISAIFTYLGMILGKKLSEKFGNIMTLLGSIILIALGISYLI